MYRNTHEFSKTTHFRLNVDRVFSKTGFGTVITGTVIGGVLSKGDTIELFPQKICTKVRGLQTHGGITDKVKFGDRAAINIAYHSEDPVIPTAKPGNTKIPLSIPPTLTAIAPGKESVL